MSRAGRVSAVRIMVARVAPRWFESHSFYEAEASAQLHLKLRVQQLVLPLPWWLCFQMVGEPSRIRMWMAGVHR